MPETTKTITVTGCAGFIGSNLSEYFLEKGYRVIGLDNFSTGFKENLHQFIDHPGFILIEGDIRQLSDCRKAVKGTDFVLHQAALGSVPRSVNDPVTTNAVNIDGFVNMLVASRDAGVKRFVYASSSSVYGDSETLPKVEEQTGNPLSPYAVTKAVNEMYADVFARVYGMETIGLRYFNVFGKRQDPNGAYAAVIPLWAKELLHHRQPVINGDENYSRDFTHVSNVCRANELAMQVPSENLRTTRNSHIHQIFNIALGGNITLKELFTALRNNLALFDPEIARIEPKIGPFRPGDIPHSQASIAKAEKMLGYHPLVDTQKGFASVSEWYFEQLSSGQSRK